MNASSPPLLPVHVQAPDLHAGFWLRVVAYLVDGVVLATVFLVLYLAVSRTLALPVDAGGWLAWRVLVAWQLAPWLYFALFEASPLQATPGKLALGLAVTDERGHRIGFGRASARFFGKLVSGLVFGIGYLLAGWSARKQALHDLMAGCCVVRKPGLAAWRNHESTESEGEGTAASTAVVPSPGMPGWAIALVVLGVVVFVGLPLAAMFAAIGIPLYQARGLRAEVAQGVQLTERARALVGEYILQRGVLPSDNGVVGLPRPEAIHASYVTSVRVQQGQVVVTYGNQANAVLNGGRVVLSPVGNAALLHWRCASPDIEVRYLPAACRQ